VTHYTPLYGVISVHAARCSFKIPKRVYKSKIECVYNRYTIWDL